MALFRLLVACGAAIYVLARILSIVPIVSSHIDALLTAYGWTLELHGAHVGLTLDVPGIAHSDLLSLAIVDAQAHAVPIVPPALVPALEAAVVGPVWDHVIIGGGLPGAELVPAMQTGPGPLVDDLVLGLGVQAPHFNPYNIPDCVFLGDNDAVLAFPRTCVGVWVYWLRGTVVDPVVSTSSYGWGGPVAVFLDGNDSRFTCRGCALWWSGHDFCCFAAMAACVQ